LIFSYILIISFYKNKDKAEPRQNIVSNVPKSIETAKGIYFEEVPPSKN